MKTIDEHGNFTYVNKNGQYHRLDGPAVMYPNGTKEWFVHGIRHRATGPAIDNVDGSKYWYAHGRLHREDGPAVIRSDDSIEYYIHGIQMSEKEYNFCNNPPKEITEMSFVEIEKILEENVLDYQSKVTKE